MRRINWIPYVVAGIIFLSGSQLSLGASASSVIYGTDLDAGTHSGNTRFAIELSKNVPFQAYTGTDKKQLIIDLPAVVWAVKKKDLGKFAKLLTSVRVQNLDSGIARVLLQLSQPVEIIKSFQIPSLKSDGSRIIIDFAAIKFPLKTADLTKSESTPESQPDTANFGRSDAPDLPAQDEAANNITRLAKRSTPEPVVVDRNKIGGIRSAVDKLLGTAETNPPEESNIQTEIRVPDETNDRQVGSIDKPAPEPVLVAQNNKAGSPPLKSADSGYLALVRFMPDSSVNLVYVAPDGKILPARVKNPQGEAVVANSIEESAVVWVQINENGIPEPLEIDPKGEILAGQISDEGKPSLPSGKETAGRVLAGQVSVDGRLLLILRPTDQGFPLVELGPEGELREAKGGPLTIKKEKKSAFGGSLSIGNVASGSTGIYNWGLTLNHDNLWNAGHKMALTVSTSAVDYGSQVVATGIYTFPIGREEKILDDTVTTVVNYNRTLYDNKIPNSANENKFKILGHSISSTYNQNIFLNFTDSGNTTLQSLTYGVTYDKSWSQNYGFAQDSKASLVRIPASITYNFLHDNELLGLFAINLGYVRNLHFGPADDGLDYSADRTGADPRYDKVVMDFVHDLEFSSGWASKFVAFSQYAYQPLIQGEAISLGGEYSVRGLEDYKTIGEMGAVGQYEISSPDILSGTKFSNKYFVFVDGGWLKKIKPDASDVGSETAVSIGGGLRFSGPAGIFADLTAGWLVGGTALRRYKDEDGRYQLYFSSGLKF